VQQGETIRVMPYANVAHDDAGPLVVALIGLNARIAPARAG
jgi:hypothetical protein